MEQEKSLDKELPFTISELFENYIKDIFRQETDTPERIIHLRKASLVSVGLQSLLHEDEQKIIFPDMMVGKPRWVYEDVFLQYIDKIDCSKFIESGIMVTTGSIDDQQLKFAHDPIAEYMAAKEIIILYRNHKLSEEFITKLIAQSKNSI